MDPMDSSQRNTPSARASFHIILPPQASIEAVRRISWLWLKNAQTISRYRIRCRLTSVPAVILSSDAEGGPWFMM